MGRVFLNEGWKFTEKFSVNLFYPGVGDSDMVDVRFPHTCKELPYNYFDENEYQMVCGYRRTLRVEEAWKGKTMLFTCEGAGHETTLYINGQEVYKHSCGYTGFAVDITPYMLYGQANVLIMKVESNETLNQPPFGFVIDYMTFGGVYREVYMDVVENTHIKDVFVKAGAAKDGKADLECQIEVSQEVLAVEKGMFIRGFLTRKDTECCPLNEEEQYFLPVAVFEEKISEVKFTLNNTIYNVLNWHVDHPYLYELTLELVDSEDNVKDTYTTTFGFRNVEFRADGFYLNGEKLKIRGLNRHQSYPYVGYAMPESMQKLDADILKFELGCNAARNSHYPQSHHFINRCDEIGLLVFMEIPGWQHIGDEAWKKQACKNVEDMILQYRNHPSIMIWGVRINESQDDDAFYIETNRIAHALDDTRPTGGVRNFRKSHLFEDVYTYNDFVHDGKKPGCEPKKNITSDMSKGHLITEYNGHMYPTKPFDWEEHRLEHALRHARVINAVGKEEDISGSFGWCMFDYNTHKDFGSGDRICYHGVTDMFRNSKLAASVYASQQEETTVLEVSSSMDIGEHPATNLGNVYIFSNADSVKMYKNGHFIKEYKPSDSAFDGIPHGPILVDDFVGTMLETEEGFSKKQSEMIAGALNYLAIHGYQTFPPHIIWTMVKAIVQYKMKPMDMVNLYIKYIGNWGETATSYRFEAIKNGEVVKTVVKEPMRKPHLETKVSHTKLHEGNTYDVAAIRIRAVDENENLLPYYQEPIKVTVEGPITVIGDDVLSLKGGMGGLYIKTTGAKGAAKVCLGNSQLETVELTFEIV
ncbi:MAG: glycoside hydrolase family 2 protein [Agathobacter sp.]|nr:glycoside hydrolase family 2 protein [Agathobacter sp.]